MGYISPDDFLKLSPRLVNYTFMIRAADNLRQYKEQLMGTKDRDQRKKLEADIIELEALFK